MAKHYWINGTDNIRTLTFGSLAANRGTISALILKSSAAVSSYFTTSFKAVATDNVTSYAVKFDTACTGGATIQGYVLWTNTGAYSNTASLSDVVYTYTPATSLTVTPSATTVWNNQSFTVKAVGNTGTRASSSSCQITWSHTAGSCISSIPASNANANSTITWGTGYTFTNNATYSFTITGSHQGGAASNAAYMSAGKISKTTSTISVKNAVTGISLANQDTTQYVAAGGSKTFALTFTVKSAGKAFSYIASAVRSAGDNSVATYVLSGNSVSAAGNLSVTGVKASSTLQKYNVSSSQSASPQTSGTVSVGVTAATGSASINSGSAALSFTYGAGTFVADSTAATYVTYSTSNGVATINFKKSGGSPKFTMSSGAVYTVTTTGRNIAGIALNTKDKGTVAVPSTAGSATSSNASVCTVSLSGTTCTVTAVAAGSATVNLGNGDSFPVTVTNITLSIS